MNDFSSEKVARLLAGFYAIFTLYKGHLLAKCLFSSGSFVHSICRALGIGAVQALGHCIIAALLFSIYSKRRDEPVN